MLLFFNCRENVNQAKKYPAIPGHTRPYPPKHDFSRVAVRLPIFLRTGFSGKPGQSCTVAAEKSGPGYDEEARLNPAPHSMVSGRPQGCFRFVHRCRSPEESWNPTTRQRKTLPKNMRVLLKIHQNYVMSPIHGTYYAHKVNFS